MMVISCCHDMGQFNFLKGGLTFEKICSYCYNKASVPLITIHGLPQEIIQQYL
jgi:hypothetical protein